VIDRYADLFDAVEYNAMFTRVINFNFVAERWARDHNLPLVGNGDIHRLRQMGTTYSLIDAAPDADAICDAIRARRVRFVASPITFLAAAGLMAELMTTHVLPAGFWDQPGEAAGFIVPRIPPSGASAPPPSASVV
jgi:hypothetical protein